MVPSDEDIREATPEQRLRWITLNAHISYVHTAWADLESGLAILFSAVLRIRIAEAQVILGSLQANRPKRDLIQNCANLSLISDAKLKLVERILRRTAKAASKRNFLAHGMAGHHQKYPENITVMGVAADLKPALQHYLSYTEKDLIALRDTIKSIAEDAHAIAPAIWRARRRPLPQTPLQTQDQNPGATGNPRQSPGERP